MKQTHWDGKILQIPLLIDPKITERQERQRYQTSFTSRFIRDNSCSNFSCCEIQEISCWKQKLNIKIKLLLNCRNFHVVPCIRMSLGLVHSFLEFLISSFFGINFVKFCFRRKQNRTKKTIFYILYNWSVCQNELTDKSTSIPSILSDSEITWFPYLSRITYIRKMRSL